MTHWMRGYRESPSIRRVAPRIPFSGVSVSPDSYNFEWLSLPEPEHAQRKHRWDTQKSVQNEYKGILQVKEPTWILEYFLVLKVLFITI